MTEVPRPRASTPSPHRNEAFAGRLATTIVVLGSLATVAGRFVVRSPLWLDEALSVDIARLPLDRLGTALRHDGHPPLYYVLLHAWMSLFGTGTGAVRALSGLISLLMLPLGYLLGRRIAGHRLGLTVGLVLATSPFVFRYGSETRMYSLVMVEVLVGWLCVLTVIGTPQAGDTHERGERSGSLTQAQTDPTPRRPPLGPLVGIGLSTAALLWTHYWSIWLLMAAGITILVGAVRSHRRHDRNGLVAGLATLAAAATGALAFVPWVPSLLYQSAHTGTPWAEAFRPTTLVITSLVDFAGGPYSEPQLAMLLLFALLVIGVFGRGLDERRIELDFHTHRLARAPLALIVGTITIASIVAIVNHMGFASRYAAVFFPFVALLVALGLDQFLDGRVRDVVVVSFVVASLVGSAFVLRIDRTQAGVVAERIRATTSSGLVVTCPDQLGPATSRALAGSGMKVVTYPRLGSPLVVDWVDYQRRNRRNDPVAVARRVLAMAADRPVFVVMNDTYLTLEGQCQAMVDELARHRPARTLVQMQPKDYFESMSLVELSPAQ
ncbi:MAG: glycosyltransferase family 39 protein [Microthrixaceae bacterium]